LIIDIGILVLLLGFAGGLERPAGRSRQASFPAPPEPGAPMEADESPEAPSPEIEEAARRILAVVRAHPEGVRLVRIGEALGTDWRLLIAPTNLLLERGLIRKEDRTYYPY
jgi:hypothetical protein